MPRKAPIPSCTDEDRQTVAEWASSRTLEWRLVVRAKMIQKCLAGQPVSPPLGK